MNTETIDQRANAAQKPEPKRDLAPLEAGGGPIEAIIPRSLEQMQRLSNQLIAGGIYTPTLSYKDRKSATPEEQKRIGIAQCVTILMTGNELGIPPMMAIKGMAVINGRVLIWGDVAVGNLLGKGFEVDMWSEGRGRERVGYCRIKRPGATEWGRTQQFTADDAIEAGLWDEREQVPAYEGKIKPNDSPWYRYKSDMLQWRAFSRAWKRSASDAMNGVFLREEMDPRFGGFGEAIDITPNDDDMPVLDVDEQSQEIDNVPTAANADIIEEVADEPIADETGLVERIRDAIAEANGDAEILEEIEDAHADLLARCSPKTRMAIIQMYLAAKPEAASD